MLLHKHSSLTLLSPELSSHTISLGTDGWHWSLRAGRRCHWKTRLSVSLTISRPAPEAPHRPSTSCKLATLLYFYTVNTAFCRTRDTTATQPTVSWISCVKDLTGPWWPTKNTERRCSQCCGNTTGPKKIICCSCCHSQLSPTISGTSERLPS